MDKTNKVIKIGIAAVILSLIITVIWLLILKYDVEGETNAPFKISKLMTISSAEGVDKKEPTAKWDLQIDQNNDIYIYIEKNEEYKGKDAIQSVRLENFNILEQPQIGQVKQYRPSNVNGILYKNKEEYEITENLEYTGDLEENIENLKIGNQGGVIYLRTSLTNIGEYKSDDQEQIKHDGTIIKNTKAQYEQIQYKIQFDMIINLESEKSYKTTIQIDLPTGNVIEEGTTNKEETENIILKRI